MFDNTLIIWISDSGEGHHGFCGEWPLVLVGGLAGRLRTAGRFLQYPNYETAGNRTIANFYLSLLHAVGDRRLVERYHQAARDVAARAVLLPKGFRFSPSPDRPTWAEETLKSLRSFHARHAGPKGEPPLAAHLAATLRHRDKLASGADAIAKVAAEEKLNATYLAALWAGLSSKTPSLLLDPIREKWRAASTDPAPVLTRIILIIPLFVVGKTLMPARTIRADAAHENSHDPSAAPLPRMVDHGRTFQYVDSEVLHHLFADRGGYLSNDHGFLDRSSLLADGILSGIARIVSRRL